MMVHRLLPSSPALQAFAVAAGLFVSAAAPAQAQVMGAAPYLPTPDPAVERLAARLETLEAELRRVTGRLEQMGFEIAQARALADAAKSADARQDEALTALVERLENVMTAPPPAAPEAGADGAAGRDPGTLPQDEAGLLRESRNLLLEGDYASAEAGFRRFLDLFPKAETTAEAQYLLAESLLYQEAYPEAAEAYVRLLSAHEKSPRAPEGLVKLARSMRLMGDRPKACEVLSQMASRFPKASDAARTLATAERSRAGC
jgi:tol-pal system protein YbgF